MPYGGVKQVVAPGDPAVPEFSGHAAATDLPRESVSPVVMAHRAALAHARVARRVRVLGHSAARLIVLVHARRCQVPGRRNWAAVLGFCFDNAVAGATCSTIEVEYVRRHQFRTRTEVRIKIATWITDFEATTADTSSATAAHRSTMND